MIEVFIYNHTIVLSFIYFLLPIKKIRANFELIKKKLVIWTLVITQVYQFLVFFFSFSKIIKNILLYIIFSIIVMSITKNL